MPQLQRLSKNNTTLRLEGDDAIVTLHSTDIVRFNAKRIVLKTGGWHTATTANRMNQASNEANLGYSVKRINGQIHVDALGNGDYAPVGDELTFDRKPFWGQLPPERRGGRYC